LRAEFIPRTADKNDVLQQAVLTHAGVPFVVGQVETRNPHRLAEAERYAARTKVAQLIVALIKQRHLRGENRDVLDVIVFFPSDGELSAYRKIFYLDEGDENGFRIDGYRLILLGSDIERGRVLYPTSLSSSTIFIGGDMLYYFNPEGFARMFESHPAIKKGLTMFLSGRHFCSHSDSLYVDRYKFQEQAACTVRRFVTVKKMVPQIDRQTGKTRKVTLADGTVSDVMKEKSVREEVDVEIPAVQAVDYVEGHGLVKPDGSFTYFASSAKGDSVYNHLPGQLDGCFLFEYQKRSVRLYDGRERYFQISVHSEWTCVNIQVLRVSIQEIDEEGVDTPIDSDSHAFVQRGVIPGILSSVRQKAAGSDLESAESMKSLYDAAFRQMVSTFGKSHYDKLPQYHQFLLDSSNRTVEMALSLSRVVPPKNIPLHGAYVDMARARVIERIVDETHVPVGVASAYARMTEKQTRAQFMVQLARTCYEGLTWLWEKVRAFFSRFGPEVEELSIPSQFVQLISVLKRNSKRVSGLVDKLLSPITKMSALRNALLKVDSWASRYPRARSIFEEVVFAGQCIVVAYGEELIKRYSPSAMSALFGAIEGLILGIGQLIDDGVTKESLARVIAQAASTALSHFILRLLPMWVAVPVHALYNYLVGRKKTRWWNELIAFLQLDMLETELDDFERAPVTLPVNLVEQSKVYYKEQDGTHVYIKDDDAFTQMIAVKQVGAKVISVLSDATRLLVKPSGSILDLVLITVSRLDKPLPYHAQPVAWDVAMRMFIEVFAEPLLDEQGPLKIYSKGELINYVNDRPWDNTRKDETIAIIRKWAAECKLRRPQDITAKEDEIIPHQPTLSDVENDNNARASKTRPICPRAEADVPAMAIAVPLKKWMAGQRYWKRIQGFPRWELVTDPSMELGFLLSVDYQMAPRADLLSAWFNRVRKFRGLHFALHGDDQYALFVDVDAEMLACAIDLSMCDKTCAEIYQQKFASFVNYVSEESHLEDVQRQYDNLVGEFQLKSRHFPPGTPALFWNKEDRSTNTGECLTSVKAIFAQLPAIFVTVDKCFVGEEFHFTKYKEHTLLEWKKLGLIPEFEVCPKGTVWHHPSAVTYLGGMFVESVPESKEDWLWISNKQLKAYMVFPAVEKIYGAALPMQKHMAVLLQDPDLKTTPIGRALARWFKRCCVVFRDFDEIRKVAMLRYEAHLAKTDRYKLEQIQENKEVGAYIPIHASDRSYYHAADHMLARNGSHFTSSDIVKIVDEIDRFPGTPQQELTTSAIPLYVLRFGNPKASPDAAEDSGLAELNIVGAIFNLGKKIFSKFNQTASPSMSDKKHKQKKNPSEKKKQPPKAKTGNGNPPPQRNEMKKAEKEKFAQFSGQVTAVTVNGSTTSQTYSVSFNPGDPLINKRTALLSAAWSQWRCRKLKFRWVPNGSAFASNNQTGEVVLNMNENWYTSISPNADSARSKFPSRTGNAWESCEINASAAALSKWRYLRGNRGAQGADANLYDILFEFFVAGTPNANLLGYLEFSGEIEFRGNYVPQETAAVRTNKIQASREADDQIISSGVAAQLLMEEPNATLTGNLKNSHLTGAWIYADGHVELTGGTYRIDAMATVTGTTLTQCRLEIIPTYGAGAQFRHNPFTRFGSTYSVAAETMSTWATFVIPEEAEGSFIVVATCAGTGTITVLEHTLLIQSFI
jgi:hypothetical protein